MFADITHGTDDHQRVGDEIFVEKLSLRIFLSLQKEHSCVTYRIIVYYTPNGVIGSSGDPTLLSDGIDTAVGFNNLLRSVDERGAHVIFEKLIIPGKNGIQGNDTEAISQFEECHINLKRNVHFQTAANTYGPKGAWTNLHVAVLAYDGSNVLILVSDEATEVETSEQLGFGVRSDAQKARVSTAPIATIGGEYTLYFKEA